LEDESQREKLWMFPRLIGQHKTSEWGSTMSRKLDYFILRVAMVWILVVAVSWAQDPTESENTAEQTAQETRFRQFSELLSPSVLKGAFTIDGKPSALEQELYELSGVSKLPSGDLWLFKARIRYGDHDVTVPLPLPVKWADDTPVITVDDFTIPGLGTFNARVVISDGKYAGTWRHGEVAGHMFGTIQKPEQSSDLEEESVEGE
jgi:hypothetical protein